MVKKTTIILGIIIAIVGILGFIKNPLIGSGSFFEANTAHNILHVVIGLVLVGVTLQYAKYTAVTLKTVGIVVTVIAIMGFISVTGSGKEVNYLFQLFSVNQAVNWLHLVIGIGLTAFGWCKCTNGTCEHPDCKTVEAPKA